MQRLPPQASALAEKELSPVFQKILEAGTAPVIAAEVGHDVLVLALLHHGDLLLDRGDVITCRAGR